MRRDRVLADVRPRSASAPTADASIQPPPRAPWLPPLNALHAFEAAGRHVSFKAAASELCVTPSAVSRQIKVLEDQLGVALFVRENRSLSLTASGSEYLASVRSAFAALAAATSAVRASSGRTVVKVGMVQSLAANWLVPRLATFGTQNPAIEVQTITSDALADVARGEVDLAIRFGQGRWPGLRADRMFAVSLFPVCAPSLLRRLRSPRDLARHPWIHLASYPQAFRAWLAHAGVPEIESEQHLTFDNSDVLFRAVAQGMGVGMATRVLVAPYLESGQLVRPFAIESPVAGAYYLVAPADLDREPAVAKVRDWLLAAASDAPIRTATRSAARR